MLSCYFMDVVGSGHEASQIFSSRSKCAFALDDACSTLFCKNTIKMISTIGEHKHKSITSKKCITKNATASAKKQTSSNDNVLYYE